MSQNNLTVNLILIIVILLLVGGFIWAYKDSDRKPDQEQGMNSLAEEPVGNNQPVVAFDYQVAADDQVVGPDNAKVTVVEWSDFECPFCASFHQSMESLIEKYPDDVRWVYKHFPLSSIHPDAQLAAEASECAGEQGKFWEYANELFMNQVQISQSKLSDFASAVGLDSEQFEQCLDSGKYQSKVSNDYSHGLKYGVSGTPGNFINGQSYPGALPLSQLEQIVESYL